MLVQLISATVVTAMALLMVWAGYRATSRRMPRSLIPILIGACMIGYGIYSEYSWESRTLAQMPDSIRVVHSISRPSPFSPWAYVIPRTSQMSLIDTAALRTNDSLPGMVIADLLIMQRLYPTSRVSMMIDCSRDRRADLTADQRFDEQGRPLEVVWVELEPDHPLLKAVCD